MKLELSLNDYNLTANELHNIVFEAVELNVSNIALLHCHLASVRKIVSKENCRTTLSVLMDYPTGASSAKFKEWGCLDAVKGGVNFLDLCLNNSLINEVPNYPILKPDIGACVKICYKNMVPLRAVLNHSSLESDTIINVGQTLRKLGVDYLVLGTGFNNDNIFDGLALAALIEKKCGIAVTVNTRTINQRAIEMIRAYHIYGIQVNSISAIRAFRCEGVGV
jgi:deoxyribose-phosphate aldolase